MCFSILTEELRWMKSFILFASSANQNHRLYRSEIVCGIRNKSIKSSPNPFLSPLRLFFFSFNEMLQQASTHKQQHLSECLATGYYVLKASSSRPGAGDRWMLHTFGICMCPGTQSSCTRRTTSLHFLELRIVLFGSARVRLISLFARYSLMTPVRNVFFFFLHIVYEVSHPVPPWWLHSCLLCQATPFQTIYTTRRVSECSNTEIMNKSPHTIAHALPMPLSAVYIEWEMYQPSYPEQLPTQTLYGFFFPPSRCST